MKRNILITVVMLLGILISIPAFADDSGRFNFSRKTIEDKRTGLTWIRDADRGRFDWIGASALVEKLNKKEYAGFNDWRLPSRDELDILVTYARRANYTGGVDAFSPYQMFNKLGFNDAQNYWYWTSSPYEDNTTYNWAISMYSGDARGESKENSLNVWPVRSGK